MGTNIVCQSIATLDLGYENDIIYDISNTRSVNSIVTAESPIYLGCLQMPFDFDLYIHSRTKMFHRETLKRFQDRVPIVCV